MLFMHSMTQPRTEGPYTGQIVDSGLHVHYGPRDLDMWTGSDAIITVPCLTLPEFINMNEGQDYIITQKAFALHEGTEHEEQRDGYEVIFMPGQNIKGSFDSGITHSFNGVGGKAMIFSHHPDEISEMDAIPGDQALEKISDGSAFFIYPQTLSSAEIEFYESYIR